MEKILFLVPYDYKEVGGLNLIISNYQKLFFNNHIHVEIIKMPYHLNSIQYIKYRKALIKYVNEGYIDIISFSLNQSYVASKMFKNIENINLVIYLIDSMRLNMTSIIQDDRNIKRLFGHILRKYLYIFKEGELLRNKYKIIYASPIDYEYVKKIYKCADDNIYLITNGFTIVHDMDESVVGNTGNIRLGMLTDFSSESYYNNLRPFLDEIYPHIKKAYPDITVTIAGRGAQKDEKEYMAKIDGVEYLGYVDNLDDFYSNVDIIITTVKKECGIINRIMEAWSYKKIVIGFSKNFAAFLNAVPGTHYLPADSPSEFIEQIQRIKDKDVDSIIENAYKLLIEEYNWNERYELMTNILER
ncbi:glycosyltransferase [Butyrivibrio fibrisolvens]|uniref:Uncharacterized protein n=1 Tax=Butyrivibrio fibrisolvens TaxID=831 RepID=A0A317FYF1_BUTFI|nr:glycosyltransferase [Butyrivibrio fibrisolvens]PWT26036.1 hypothetical protein CPT75_02345 [Butyrivibrio fibrisolvens]